MSGLPRLGISIDATPLQQAFWDAARRHELALQRCLACARAWHPPSERCPACQAGEWEWVAASGSGTVYSFTTLHHPVHAVVADRVPYTVALIEVAEGPRVVGLVRGAATPPVAAAVTLAFEDYEELTLPVWHRASP
jgi:uncharacterized OB-fold protein